MKRMILRGGALIAVAALILVTPALGAVPAATTTSKTGGTGAQSYDFPTFGMGVSVPAGWTRIPEGGPGHVGRWALSDEKSRAVQGALIIEVEPLGAGATLDEYVQKTAKENGGVAGPQKVNLGGEPAVIVSFAGDVPALHPNKFVVAARGGYAYVFSIFVAGGKRFDAEFDAAMKSWKWMRIESTDSHLELMDKATPIFNGAVQMQFPALARPYAERGAGDHMMLGIYDYTTASQPLMFTMDLLPKDAAKSFKEIQQQLGPLLQAKFSIKEMPPWTDVKSDVPVCLCGPVRASVSMPGKAAPFEGLLVYGLVQPAPDQVMMITFTISAKNPEPYTLAVQRTMASIRKPVSQPAGQPSGK
jgi:hypothetical protein